MRSIHAIAIRPSAECSVLSDGGFIATRGALSYQCTAVQRRRTPGCRNGHALNTTWKPTVHVEPASKTDGCTFSHSHSRKLSVQTHTSRQEFSTRGDTARSTTTARSQVSRATTDSTMQFQHLSLLSYCVHDWSMPWEHESAEKKYPLPTQLPRKNRRGNARRNHSALSLPPQNGGDLRVVRPHRLGTVGRARPQTWLRWSAPTGGGCVRAACPQSPRTSSAQAGRARRRGRARPRGSRSPCP